jgi:hypothetical protein
LSRGSSIILKTVPSFFHFYFKGPSWPDGWPGSQCALCCPSHHSHSVGEGETVEHQIVTCQLALTCLKRREGWSVASMDNIPEQEPFYWAASSRFLFLLFFCFKWELYKCPPPFWAVVWQSVLWRRTRERSGLPCDEGGSVVHAPRKVLLLSAFPPGTQWIHVCVFVSHQG